MVIRHIFDQLSLGMLFLVTILVLLLLLEVGYRLGYLRTGKPAKAQTAQVRALMGATLGLLAFMLAFTFSTAQSHYENRVQLQIEDARLAKSAFLQADLLPEADRSQVRTLLYEVTSDRLKLGPRMRAEGGKAAFAVVKKADGIYLQLWQLATETKSKDKEDGSRAASANALQTTIMSLMNIQTQRVQAALVNRIPVIIWITLYFTAFMAMIVVGYQAGLSRARSPIATIALALAFAAVMMLIIDLDRPVQSMFSIDTSVVRDLESFMRTDLQRR